MSIMVRSPDPNETLKSSSSPDLSTLMSTNKDSPIAAIFRKRKHPDNSFTAALDSFSDEIMSKLNDWKFDMDSRICEIKDNIISSTKDLKRDIQSIKADYASISLSVKSIQRKQEHEFSEIRKTIEFITSKQNDLEARIVPLEANLKSNESLESEVSLLQAAVRDLSCQLKEQQQWDRMLNLEIAGVPDLKNEDLADIAIKISCHAGVDLGKDDIVHVSRVQSRTGSSGRPKAVVLKLRKRLLKDNILAGLRKQHGISTSDIGMPGNSQRIFVNEHLTVENKFLYKKCRDAARAKQYQYVWIKNCKIFMRKNDSSPFIHVRDESFLNKLR